MNHTESLHSNTFAILLIRERPGEYSIASGIISAQHESDASTHHFMKTGLAGAMKEKRIVVKAKREWKRKGREVAGSVRLFGSENVGQTVLSGR